MKTSLVGSMIVLGTASLTASAEEFSWGLCTHGPIWGMPIIRWSPVI